MDDDTIFDHLANYPVLMPTRNSIIRPFVERLLITNGVGSPPTQIETVSDAFGRAFVRDSDAVWIISEEVAAHDVAEGKLVALPIDTSETTGPVGLTMRTDMVQTAPLQILVQTIREAADH